MRWILSIGGHLVLKFEKIQDLDRHIKPQYSSLTFVHIFSDFRNASCLGILDVQ